MKIKKIMGVVLSICMIMGSNISSFAAGPKSVEPRSVGTTVTHNWSYEITGTSEQTAGKWTHFYTGEAAARTGETDSVSSSVTYSHTFSGTFGGSLKGDIQAALGYSFGKSETFAISKTSAKLNAGEYVKAYYIKNYGVTKIKQTDLKRTTGYELSGGQYHPVDRIETITSNVQAKKAIQPKIKLEYWKDNKKIKTSGAEDSLTKVEYYEYANGSYHRVDGE